MWWCNFEIYPFYNFFHNCWHGLLWSMQRSFKIWLKAGYDGPKNGTFTKSSVKTPSHSQLQGLKFFKNNQVGPWIQLDPKRRLGPLIILSFSSQNHVFSLSHTLTILSLIRSLLSLTHNGKTIILLSLFESVPWKQLSRNFQAFPHHRCCWFLTEGSDRVLRTPALVLHSHGRESLSLDLDLSLGLCAKRQGNETHDLCNYHR